MLFECVWSVELAKSPLAYWIVLIAEWEVLVWIFIYLLRSKFFYWDSQQEATGAGKKLREVTAFWPSKCTETWMG